MAVNIYDFADIIGEQLIIIYYPNQERRFTSKFENGDIIEKGREGVLCGTYGDGNSPINSLKNYCVRISGQKIVFNGNSDREKIFNIPELEV